MPRRRMRGAVSFFFNDLAAAALGPLAGHEPSGGASSCSSAHSSAA